ncbi:HfaB protein [Rhodobacterales bacterium HKCCSP123]|nr:HfaB protein [Rhodobacterales bacterium HKCCSP123]
MPSQDVELFDGPPVTDIVTTFDEALYCLRGRIDSRMTFGVGGIPDQTGRDQNSTEGTGRFVTQGAGDIVQSALFNAGVTLINRRDMGSAALEAQWGIRDLSQQRPANLVVTGSINSLDFLPGGGAIASVGGIGPRYRQNRILVGMDLAMTNNATGQIVANIALRKQLVADELGFMVATTSDNEIVDLDFGGSRREALHFALREMLQLATFELLTQLMPPAQYEDCRAIIDETMAVIDGEQTSGGQIRQLEARREAQAAAAAAAAQATPVSAEEVSAATSPAQDAETAVATATPSPATAPSTQTVAAEPAPAPAAPTPQMGSSAILAGISSSDLGPDVRRVIEEQDRAAAAARQAQPAALQPPAPRPETAGSGSGPVTNADDVTRDLMNMSAETETDSDA